MIAAAVWLLLQGGAPTVGDTLWVSRAVAVPAGRTLRPADWRPDDPIELLGPPRVTERGDSTIVAYPIVVWKPGTQETDVPGPLLLGAGGVDSLPARHLTLEIASVLPRVPVDSTLAPQPRAAFVPREARSPLPVLLALGLAALLLAPLHWWWRRRGRAARPAPPLRLMPELPLKQWADDGEPRAVAAAVTASLRTTIAELVPTAHHGLDTDGLLAQLAVDRPDWPLDRIAAMLRALDEARFKGDPMDGVLELARDARWLEARLAGGNA